MTTVTIIDDSHRNKQESLCRQEMILKDHQNIHGEIIHDGYDTSNPIEAGWETSSLTQHNNNQSKPAPGCRQILFKKMKLRMSCEPIDNKARAEIYVHEEPCIFCRMFASRAAEMLVQNNNNAKLSPSSSPSSSPSRRRGRDWRRTNGAIISGRSIAKSQPCSKLSETDAMVELIMAPYLLPSERTVLNEVPEICDRFNLKDHFCPKHGNKYKPDDEIWNVPPKRRVKKGGGKINYMMPGKLLEKIIRDGKDPIVFQSKLEFRRRPFPAHMSDDHSLNKPEISLAEDPDYGKYFRRMKKCIKCEKEADERQKAKKGLIKCGFCNKYHHFSEQKNCSKCHEVLNCNKCPGYEMNPQKCGQCQSEFCANCCKVVSCGSCGKSSCEGCIETAECNFVDCSHCEYSYCSQCDVTYSCEICGELLCYFCRDGGILDCKCGKTLCCTECEPQKQCDICGERKCLDCYNMKENMNCSVCDKSSCKKCADVYKCEVCNQSFCNSCRDKNVANDCKTCKNKVCCNHCGGNYMCTSCGKAHCLICVEMKERCQLCNGISCDSCGVVESCAHCGIYFCHACKPVTEKSCADCGGHWCQTCTKDNNFRKCERCGDDHCGLCRTTDTCDTCNIRFCSKCTTKCKSSGLVNCKVCMTKLDEFYNKIWVLGR